MAFILNEEQQEIIQLIDDFFTREVDPHLQEWDATSEPDISVIRKAMELGFHKLDIPEEHGGSGLDLYTMSAAIECMGRHDIGFASGFTTTTAPWKIVLGMGTNEQKTWADRVFGEENKIGCFCLTEPSGGSDASAMRTTAVRDGDDYIINGTKCFITSAEYGEIFAVMAVTDKTKGAKGISCFMVDRNLPGVQVGKHEDKLGFRTSYTNEIAFQDVRVNKKWMVGPEGLGFIIAMNTLDGARLTTGTMALGLAQRALEESVKYAKERVAFGKPIIAKQGIAFMLADMEARVQVTRSMIEHTVQLIESGKPFIKEASICKMIASEYAMQNAIDAVQILGGYGCCKEYPVEKLLRDAKVLCIVEGTTQIQKDVIARHLAKEY